MQGKFDLVVTYAVSQSHIHCVTKSPGKVFVCGNTIGDHHGFIGKVVEKIKAATWKPPIKAETVKSFAKGIASKM